MASSVSVTAGEVQGLINEFMEVEDFLSKKKPSPEFRKKMLDKNLLDSIKNTLSRKYKVLDKELSALKIEDIDYERQVNTYKFYIRYKKFYIYYDFEMDPEIYIQLPKEVILYTKPDNYDKNAPHKEDTTVMPEPGK
jgi:hypothetical protein